MSTVIQEIHLLPIYANPAYFTSNRYETRIESEISFTEGDIRICLNELNSLVEDKYSMNFHTAKYLLEGREVTIHHHPKGHPFKHIQFKLKSENKEIRINLEPLDIQDYQKCIKGFLYISKIVMENEKKELDIKADVVERIFNDKIEDLRYHRVFLLNRIKQAYASAGILDDSNHPISSDELENLRQKPHLLPFLNWEK
jgi:hypothetical protein